MKKLKTHQIEILIKLVDQDISNYRSVLERTGKQTWQDKIDELMEIRIELYNELILCWYDKGHKDENTGSSSVMPDDKTLNKAYIVGAADAVIESECKDILYVRTEDEIIRKIISNG